VKLRNINPLGAVRVAALDMQLVGAGEVVDVGDDAAALMVIQTANWELADKPAKGERELADKIIADHLAELAAASAPPGQQPQPEPAAPAVDVIPGEGESL
jgi:hypothetical protein